MSRNDDKLDFYKSELGVSTGALPDLEYQWLRSKVGSYIGSIPDMWREYLRTLGYDGSISDAIQNLPYPLSPNKNIVFSDWMWADGTLSLVGKVQNIRSFSDWMFAHSNIWFGGIVDNTENF